MDIFDIKKVAGLGLIILITVLLTRWMSGPSIIYSTEAQQQKLDSLTVELRNTITDRNTILDSLDATTEAFRERLERRDEQIASYTQIIGSIRAERDSLAERMEVSLTDLLVDERVVKGDDAGAESSDPPLNGWMFRDTTLVNEAVFGDSLLVARATGGIENNGLFVNPPEIDFLRPIRLDVAVTIADDKSAVHTIVTSRDLHDLHVQSLTEIEPPRHRFPRFWVGVGVGVGAVLLLGQ